MHIVFGGIFNGKRKYVKEHFLPTLVVDNNLARATAQQQTLSIENFWHLIDPYIAEDEVTASEKVMTEIRRLALHNKVICVCDDVSRGVVPMDAVERKKRDILGRLYQQLFSEATTITRIWYGLPEKMK